MQLDSSRLAVVRRFYVYAVAFISYLAGLVALNTLTQILLDIWLPAASLAAMGEIAAVGRFDLAREAIARSAGLLVVATPLFLLHWWYANHRLIDPAERQAALRKLYLYGATAAGVAIAYGSLYQLINDLLFYLLPRLSAAIPVAGGRDLAGWLQNGLFSLCGAAFLWYWQQILAQDGDYGREQARSAQVRRIFLALVGLAGGALLLFGAADLLEQALRWPATRHGAQVGSVTAGQTANGVALLVVGLMLSQAVARSWGRLTAADPDEGRSALRRCFLFAGMLGGAVAVLTPATLILRELLLILFGGGSSPRLELYLDLVKPLAFLPPGALLFWAFRRELARETAHTGQSPESVTVQRVAHYLTAAVGLTLSWIGMVEVLQALVDLLTGNRAVEIAGRLWIDPLATGLSLLAVGLPLWITRWRLLQAAAHTPGRNGEAERVSGPRRIYLYSIALVSALLTLFSLAQILYRLFLLLMGEPAAVLWSSETASEFARGGVALLIWLYHIRVIRLDSRLSRATVHETGHEDAEARHQAMVRLEARVMLLEADLAAARAALTEARRAASTDEEET